jgi:hypothetical protein
MSSSDCSILRFGDFPSSHIPVKDIHSLHGDSLLMNIMEVCETLTLVLTQQPPRDHCKEVRLGLDCGLGYGLECFGWSSKAL